MIGQMAMMAQATDLAREYLERAVKAGQESGQAHMILGVLSVLADDDLQAANKHWRQAERIARKEGDSELMERIGVTRAAFSTPAGLFGLLAGGPFSPGGLDLDGLPDDLFDEDLNDDDF